MPLELRKLSSRFDVAVQISHHPLAMEGHSPEYASHLPVDKTSPVSPCKYKPIPLYSELQVQLNLYQMSDRRQVYGIRQRRSLKNDCW